MDIKYFLVRRVQLAFAAAIFVLLVVGVFSYRGIVASSDGEKWVRHTHEVMDNLQELQISMEALELANRGYILTGDENYLSSYREAAKRVAGYQASLLRLTADNPQQQHRLSALELADRHKVSLPGPCPPPAPAARSCYCCRRSGERPRQVGHG